MASSKNTSTQKLIQKYKDEMFAYKERAINPVIQVDAPISPPLVSNNSDTMGYAPVQENSTTTTFEEPIQKNRFPEDLYIKFTKNNPAKGYLKVQTLTARKTYPVPKAKVTVLKSYENNNNYEVTTATTNESGLTKTITLPAIPKEESEVPGFEHPYTSYTIVIEHPDFLPIIYYNVPVFENIISTQTADMTLKSAALPGQTKIEITEYEPKDLN